jgi:hypothetical protein
MCTTPICTLEPMTREAGCSTMRYMTKHAAGKYGRTIGRKETKALVAPANGAWCYLCGESHRWSTRCAEEAARLRASLPV